MLLNAIISGFIGSVAMLVVLYLIHFSNIAHADMVRALGSLLSKKMEGSVKIGLVTYFLGGLFFGLIYVSILHFFPIQEFGPLLFVGTFLGFAHGWVVSFALVISVAGRHPLPEFQDVGYGVALAHFIGHVVYGATVALTYNWLTHPEGTFPTVKEIGPYGVYAIMVVVIGLIMTVASAAITSNKRRHSENRNKQVGQHRVHQP